MTIEQFIAHWRETREPDTKTNDQGMIRTACGHCPITAVAVHLGYDDWHPFAALDVGSVIGLSTDDAKAIMRASDMLGCDDNVPEDPDFILRKRLLA